MSTYTSTQALAQLGALPKGVHSLAEQGNSRGHRVDTGLTVNSALLSALHNHMCCSGPHLNQATSVCT